MDGPALAKPPPQEGNMLWIPEAVKIIYVLSQAVAGLAGIAVFILMIRAVGFDSTKTTGDSTVIMVGANFVLSILVALLSVGPLFFYESEYSPPPSPDNFFLQSYWIVYALILAGNAAGLARSRRPFGPVYGLIPLLGLVTASWVAKTLDMAIFVFRTGQMNLFMKIVFEVLNLALGAVYFALPAMAVRFLGRWERKKIQSVGSPGTGPGGV
jgi:hypothetical protein